MTVARNVVAHSHAGEIIAPSDLVDVVIRPSPFRQEKKQFSVPAGLTIGEIIEDCAEKAGLHPEKTALSVSLNGHSIIRDNWDRTRVKPGVTVNVVAVPRGKAIGKILGAIISLVAAVVAPYLATAVFGFAAGTTGFTIATGLIGAGLSMAGSLIVNALFPPAQPNNAVEDTKTLYSIGGAQNESTQYGAIPTIFGRHRISPPYASGPYTEIIGDDQYLRMLFCVGYGPISMTDLKIGETPISKFDGVTMEVIENHIATPPTLYTQPVYEEDVSVLMEFADSWTTRTTADKVQEISVDISFPNGVYQVRSSNGEKVNYTVGVEVQYAVAGSGSWVSGGSVTLTTNSTQAVRRTVSWSVASGQYDVRVRKSTPDNPTVDDQVSEAVYFSALRGRRRVPAIKFDKPLSVIALRIKATNELSGVVDKLNMIATPLITAWNGTAWVGGQATSNPADHFRHVLQGNANARPVADEMIDIDGLQEWHAYCAAKGFTFNFVSTEQKSVYEQLQQIASAGRAAVSLRDGKWGVVWDVEDSPIVQHFSPRNSWDFSSVRAYADLPHGFRVSFINKDNGYLNDERVVYDDGYTEANATKFEGLDFPGVVDKDLIWKHGRYHLAQLRLQRETYTLTTDFENLVCTRGDRVRVNHDTVLWGLGAGRVSQVTSSPDTVTIDDTFPMEAGKTYSMRFRLDDGTSIVRQITGADGEYRTFTLDGSGDLPARGDLTLFGENGLDSVVLRVKGVTALADMTARIELVDDAPEILLADMGDIPDFETGIAPLIDYRSYAPRQLTYVESIWTKASGQSMLKLAWLPPEVGSVSSYIVQYAAKGSNNWKPSATVSGTAFDLTGIDAGVYDVRVRAVFTNGQLSDWDTETMVAAIFANPPADVQGFRISIAGDTATLRWDDPQDETVGRYQIRFSPLTSGVTWQTSAKLRDDVTGTSVQISAMVGTYLIKAVTYAGLVSENAVSISSTVDPLTSFNAVEELQEAPAFSGNKTGVAVAAGQLRLENLGDVFDFPDFFGVPDFFLSGGGFPAEGIYEFADVIDLGGVYTSRVSAEIVAFGELTSEDAFYRVDWFEYPDFFGTASESLWDVTVELSTTNDDTAGSPVWSDWGELVTSDISARGYRFRAILQSQQYDVTPVITGLAATVDMPDRVIAENDLVISTSGQSISFSPPYFTLSGLSISAQGLQAGDYYEITSKDASGFSIIFRDGSGTPVERTLDYVAKGYGSIQ